MAYNLRPSNRQKLSTVQKGLLISGGASVLTLAIYLGITFNTVDINSSQASVQLMEQDPVNNGDVVLGFGWDESICLKADIGTDAIDISVNAECIPGGKDSTWGLSAGNSLKNLNLILPSIERLNNEGIDIAID